MVLPQPVSPDSTTTSCSSTASTISCSMPTIGSCDRAASISGGRTTATSRRLPDGAECLGFRCVGCSGALPPAGRPNSARACSTAVRSSPESGALAACGSATSLPKERSSHARKRCYPNHSWKVHTRMQLVLWGCFCPPQRLVWFALPLFLAREARPLVVRLRA